MADQPEPEQLARDVSDHARQVSDDARRMSDDEIRDVVASLATTAQKIAAVADQLVPAMSKLARSNETLATKNHQKNVVIASLIILGVVAGLFGWRLQVQSTCFGNWANNSTNRSGVLGPLSNKRNDDLGRLGVDVIKKVAPAQGMADVSKFLDAENAYNAAYAETPIPASPKFSCPAF